MSLTKKTLAVSAILAAAVTLSACEHMMHTSAATGQSANTATVAGGGGNMAAGGGAAGGRAETFPNVKSK